MNDATKTCPMCAEAVKAAAVRCRFCGYDFAGGSPSAPSRGEKTADAVSGGMMKFAGGLVLILLLVSFCGKSESDAPPIDVASLTPAETVQKVEPISAEQRAECKAALAKAETAGLIRKIEPSLKRVTVDETTWREIGPDARVGVMAFAACDWFGSRFADISDDQRITVVGWQSGDRLASSMGGLYAGN